MIFERSVQAPVDSKLLDLRSFELLAPYAARHGYDATDKYGMAAYSRHGAGYRGAEKVTPASWAWGISPGFRDARYAGDRLEIRLVERGGPVWPVTIQGWGVFEDQGLLFDVYRSFHEAVRTPLIR